MSAGGLLLALIALCVGFAAGCWIMLAMSRQREQRLLALMEAQQDDLISLSRSLSARGTEPSDAEIDQQIKAAFQALEHVPRRRLHRDRVDGDLFQDDTQPGGTVPSSTTEATPP